MGRDESGTVRGCRFLRRGHIPIHVKAEQKGDAKTMQYEPSKGYDRDLHPDRGLMVPTMPLIC